MMLEIAQIYLGIGIGFVALMALMSWTGLADTDTNVSIGGKPTNKVLATLLMALFTVAFWPVALFLLIKGGGQVGIGLGRDDD